MSEKIVKIGFVTTADATGAKQAETAIDKVVDKAEELDDALAPKPGGGLDQIPKDASPAINAIDAVVDKAEELEDALTVDPGKGLEKIPAGALPAATALDNVADSANDAASAVTKVDGSKGIEKIAPEAKFAAGSIDQLEDSLSRLLREMNKLPVGSKEFVALADRVKLAKKELNDAEVQTQKLAGVVGRRGNAGMAVLEFSRAFEDAQYGMRGVLNNIPGLIAMLGGGAGLAGVISVAAVAATQLWERLGDDKKSDPAFKAVNKVREAIVAWKDALQSIQKAENERNTTDALEAYNKQKTALDLETAAIDRSNAALKSNLDYRGEIQKIQTRDALRDVDSKERKGDISPEAANKERVKINATDVVKTLELQQKTQDLELKSYQDKYAASIKNAEIAASSLVIAQMELDMREGEIARQKQQATLRAGLDKEMDTLVARRDAKLIQALTLPSSEFGADPTIPRANLTKEADALAEEIRLLAERIAKAAPEAVRAYEVTDQDGNQKTIDPNKKIREDLTAGGRDGKSPSLEALEAQVNSLNSAAQSAADQVRASAEALGDMEEKNRQAKANAGDLALRDNAALRDVETKAAAGVEALLTEIIGKLPEAAQRADVAPLIDKIRNLAKDGVQRNEIAEADELLAQIANKLETGTGGNRQILQKILTNSQSTIDLFNTLDSTLAGQKSQIDELKRGFETLKNNQGKK